MVKVALVGAGRMGRVHLDVYKSLPGVEVMAAVDVDTEQAKEKIKGMNTRLYSDVDSMLAAEEIDMADICTPTYVHAEHAIKIMDRGVHVLCEKPISLDVDSARKMVEASRRNNVFFMVAQVIRFWPEYEYLKKVYDAKTYGNLRQVLFTRVGEMTKTSWQDWMRDKEKSGKAPVDLHIHDTDFILHLLGRPKAVTSFCKDEGKNISWINTHYEYDDIMVEAEGAWYGPAYPFSMSYRAVFENAVLEYKDRKLMLYESGKGARQVELEAVKADGQLNVGSVNGYRYEIEYFVNCVRNNTPPQKITPDEAAASLEVVYREIESARTGRKIVL